MVATVKVNCTLLLAWFFQHMWRFFFYVQYSIFFVCFWTIAKSLYAFFIPTLLMCVLKLIFPIDFFFKNEMGVYVYLYKCIFVCVYVWGAALCVVKVKLCACVFL